MTAKSDFNENDTTHDASAVTYNSVDQLAATLDSALEQLQSAHKLLQVARERQETLLPSTQTKLHELTELVHTLNDSSVPQQTDALPTKRFETLTPTQHESDDDVNFGEESKPATTSQPSIWSGFYSKTLRERFDVLSLMYPNLQRIQPSEPESSDSTSKLGDLPLREANLMVENCVGVLGLPLGLGLNFVIDGKALSVPMAVEEPSVVAAASSAAKLVAAHGGGFSTATTGNVMTSQIQLVDVPDIPFAMEAIESNKQSLMKYANVNLCPNMAKRHGGVVDVYCRLVKASDLPSRKNAWYTPCDDEISITPTSKETNYLVVHIDVDVCEAMGANIVNTVAEGLSDEICRLTNGRAGLRILTNLCMQRRARASFEIPLSKLGWKGVSGEEVASKMLEAYNFAAIDPFRAVTNNKGIMNGVDAAALASGQDWRAIEAAAHCYASRSGQYASLSHYEVVDTDNGKVFRGSLELPLSVGSKGGALLTHPGYASTRAILKYPTARQLSGILVSVGLAQNFAAMRAIAVTGIQKGHMALHARNIAVAAGASSELVAEVCTYMNGRSRVNMETAKEYLSAHAVFSEIRSTSPPRSPVNVHRPSMFYVELPVPHLDDVVSLNLAFEAMHSHPQFIAITPQTEGKVNDLIRQQLLGDKGYARLGNIFSVLAPMRRIIASDEQDVTSRANLALQNKLQLLSVLINILSYRLLEVRPEEARKFLSSVVAHEDPTRSRALLMELPPSDELLATGLPLVLALWQVLHYHIEQDVPHTKLREALVSEQRKLLRTILESQALAQKVAGAEDEMVASLQLLAKRWQATMLLLIDSLSLPTDVLTPSRLHYLHQIGEYLEWEGTIAHDCSRYERALVGKQSNVFVLWMERQGAMSEGRQDFDALIEEFKQLANVTMRAKWDAIVQEKEKDEELDLFSLEAVEDWVAQVRQTYTTPRE